MAPGEFVDSMPVRVDIDVIPEPPEYEESPLIEEMRHPDEPDRILDLFAEKKKHEAEHEDHDPCCNWHVPPKWDMFRGNNHSHIINQYSSMGGGVRFTEHIGKPLTDHLWRDLIYRMHINRLRIYKPHEGRWMDGLGDGACVISLDEEDLVKDIYFVPHKEGFAEERSLGYQALLRALEIAVAKVEGRSARTFQGRWHSAKKGIADPSWEEVLEALELGWESGNEPVLFYECPPTIAYINSSAASKIKVE